MTGTENNFGEKTIIVKDEEAIRSLEKKISHLSGLLSDSESENHRMFELIEVLKEEIRSYRRSEDRIKHIEHQEYVKNVILKFVTMSNCDEKKQLLPIVSKLLVLSPSEIKTIEATMDNDPLSEGVDQIPTSNSDQLETPLNSSMSADEISNGLIGASFSAQFSIY
ncbi:GCC2 [Lepeophtheirus salmonis]|uniref:GCC2 n=1 Tax=Lepeophtheirus salmonis TaxID=72036 RepID=A0A7R8H780_LEPSM|nr:GCC2 [Lepeophtheirus salmonis]CAF2918169.1 GCC2 [Lepeophtheirus salmonis]